MAERKKAVFQSPFAPRQKDEIRIFDGLSSDSPEDEVPGSPRKLGLVPAEQPAVEAQEIKRTTVRFPAETKNRLGDAAWLRRMDATHYLIYLIDTYGDGGMTIEAEELLKAEAKKTGRPVSEILNALIIDRLKAR